MKNLKRTLSLLLCIVMLFTCFMPLTACKKKKCEHIDGDGNGTCDICGKEVTIECNDHTDGDNNGKCDKCGFAMIPGQTTYAINIKTVGGMPLEGVNVIIYLGNNIKALPATTDENGNVSFTLDTATGYTIALQDVPLGYNVLDGATEATRYSMQPTGAQIILSSKPVTEGKLLSNYNVGDIMYDFTIKDVNGNEYKLSTLLETKKMVMLNFWYTECSWCNKEFPGLNASYKNHKSDVEILALNDYGDSLDEIKRFSTTGSYEGEENNLVMPMFKVNRGEETLTIDKFGGFGAGSTGYPTTIIIDRYGLICMIEQGAIVGEAKWDKIFNYFTSSNYTQKLIEKAEDLTPPEKPNVAWGGSDGIAANFNGQTDMPVSYAPEEGDEWSWPFVPAEVGGYKVVKPSNKSDNSYGILYANIQLRPGQAVMFDYFTSCEYGNDRLVMIVDGNDICSLTGVNIGDPSSLENWEQCCAYVDPRPTTAPDELVTYEVAFAYIKDTETSEGDDTVYLKNLRVVGVDEITTETYIVRDAVSGPTADKGGFNTYVSYVLGDDGYYHVGSKTGPLLLVNHLGYTNFDSNKSVSQRIMDEEKILVGGVDKYYTWMVYSNASANASLYGFTPVTEELKEILIAYCDKYRNTVGKDEHADIWLQLCSYYDAYGLDKNGDPTKPMPDPIKGLTTFSAFETSFKANPEIGDTETYSVTYDRVIMPRGYLYKFTPSTSGVYRVTSKSDTEVHGWIFTGTSHEWMAAGSQDRVMLVDFEEEERYCPDLNYDIGNGQIVRDNNNVSLVAYMEAGEDYYIDIAYYDIYAEGTFDFEIKYEGASGSVFVMASPGPITFIEGSEGEITGLIALGIDYDFKNEGGVKYAYQVLERNTDKSVKTWGEKIYADFYYPTTPFSSQSIVELAEIGAFNYKITDTDREALELLEEIRLFGKNKIIAEWIADGDLDAANTWKSKDLDTLMKIVQKNGDTTGYDSTDIATAAEAVALGTAELRREWGSDADKNWNDVYKMDDVLNGIYHDNLKEDKTALIEQYMALMDDGATNPERQGCVAVTEELAQLLSELYSKYNFENVQHDWLKFCYYYKQLSA